MSDFSNSGNEFLIKISDIVEDNLSNEQFGVSELAHEIGMSRSNLLRKIKKLTGLSVSQFIRQVRLKNAMELLQTNSLTVSEVSYKVGFGSTSYFVKCFGEHYGYPPGEASKREMIETKEIQPVKKNHNLIKTIIISSVSLILILVIIIIVIKLIPSNETYDQKSIAVLPFKNDSNDSSNVYLINGLMESLLNDLQKVKDLRVISRTSVEKYRNNSKVSIPIIGKELNVAYVIEGSGQKIGDQILLNIQLIEASTDRHLWAKKYSRESKDIFQLQSEIAKNIADEIKVIITPEEEARIHKIPTNNLVAYDYFLKGLDLFFKGNSESLHEAINYFKKAIEHDDNFARAYADIALSYYYLDKFQVKKKYSDSINNYAEKAILIDPRLEQGLTAKAVHYLNIGKNSMAVPYLEKALEYNPNSPIVIGILSDYYATISPDTKKYLEYALMGARIDIASPDSVTTSYMYLHLSNALIQSGFINESLKYINKSLDFFPNNLYSEYVKAYILLAKNGDFEKTKFLLIEALKKDSTRVDIIQEIGKICYFMRDYECAYRYYSMFMEIRDAYNLNIYRGENGKIAIVLDKMGYKEKSQEYFNDYLDYATNDKSIYKQLSLAAYYSSHQNTEKAMEHLRLFSLEDNYFYWIVLFLQDDPIFDNIKDHPDFKSITSDIEKKFMKYHKDIKSTLDAKELL